MRIVFVTTDDVFYLPRFFRRVLADWSAATAAMVVLPAARSRKRTLARAWALYGPAGFLWNAARYAARRLGGRLSRWVPAWRALSVAGVAGEFGVPVVRPASVNAPDFLAWLRRAARPDLIVSVAAPEIFRQQLLSLAPLGCVNVHGALLPRHRGMLPSFWSLLHGEREGGVTVHYMSAGIDEGPIIAQRRFPIGPDDTVDSLIRRSKAIGAELLAEVLTDLERGQVRTVAGNGANGTYHSFPTRDDVKRLRALGRRVM